MEDFMATVLPGPADTEDIRGQLPPNFIVPPNFVVLKKFALNTL